MSAFFASRTAFQFANDSGKNLRHMTNVSRLLFRIPARFISYAAFVAFVYREKFLISIDKAKTNKQILSDPVVWGI